MNFKKRLFVAQRYKYGAGAKFEERNTSANQNKIIGGRRHRPYLALMAIILGWGVAAQAQSVKGSGTPGTIPVWSNSSMIGNSIVSQSGGNINVSGSVKASGSVTAPSFSGSFSGNGFGLSNVNASMLGGLGASGFAQLGAPNSFNADQTINGNLNLSGSLNNALILQGNLNANGEQSANVIGGFIGSSSVPGNSVASGFVGATIAGGGGSLPGSSSIANTVTGAWGTVGGGGSNTAARFGTVGGGLFNNAGGFIAATVGGGRSNTAGEFGTVAGGDANTASGLDATIPGGFGNTAAGTGSFAAGFEATANSNGSFVWSDYGHGGVSDIGPNSFVARASGGFAFYTAAGTSTGASLPAGSGSWASLSDRSVKANLMAVDGQAILERLVSLPISTWNYKTQSDSVRHMGPMAQDFRAAFGLGEDEKHISTVDSEGVALAAIQALYQEKQQLKERLEALESRLAALESKK